MHFLIQLKGHWGSLNQKIDLVAMEIPVQFIVVVLYTLSQRIVLSYDKKALIMILWYCDIAGFPLPTLPCQGALEGELEETGAGLAKFSKLTMNFHLYLAPLLCGMLKCWQ